ncbi:hypothetical protein EBB59_04015 [Lysobacter pythonis]|uniref:Uncharacterized protein n=1 Tax=Solilutibacter pythonis TaxID=2483112 RepID=A0A3M2I2K3_9GAMM|nr:hypothetical protein [Lysobacter pythonis]RMH93819.1 hypothetical protein EBB59_04015 [Lysobacter pythonis]
MQAKLILEQLEKGRNPVIASYHEAVSRCQQAGWAVKPLNEAQVAKLGTRRIELAVDAGHRLARSTEWNWSSPNEPHDALCQFEFVEKVREDYTDERIIGYTSDEADAHWQEAPADPSDLEVAITEVDYSADQATGWQQETASQVAGQACTWWRNSSGERVCMWTAGLSLGFAPNPSPLCVTEPAEAFLKGLPLGQEPANGTGCRITVESINVGAPLSPAVLALKTRGGSP